MEIKAVQAASETLKFDGNSKELHIRYNSFSLPYYYCDGRVSFFDIHGTKHIVEGRNFRDITTDGGRFWQFYTYEVFVADVSKKGGVEC